MPGWDVERRDRLLWWAAVAAWAGVILTLSGSDFSAASTSRFLGPLLHWLLPDQAALRELLHFIGRKLAHLGVYGVFGALAYRAGRRSALPVALAVVTALGLVLALAVIDEAHQATLAARTGSAWDVAIDLAGGALALALVLTLRAARRALPARG